MDTGYMEPGSNEKIERVYLDPASISLDLYLHGHCTIAAIILNRKFGYKIVRLSDKEENDICRVRNCYTDFPLIHDFCIDGNGKYLDARGKTNSIGTLLDPFEDFFDIPVFSPLIEKNAANILEKDYQNLLGQKTYDTLYQAFEKWVEDHISWYEY